MPRIPVTIDDPRLDCYRNLKATNRTRWSGQFIAEGKFVVERLIQSDFDVEHILVSDRQEASIAEWVPDSVTMFVTSLEELEELIGFNFHMGVLGCGLRKDSPSIESFVTQKRSTLVVCPRVSDPDNIGAMIRMAAAFGIDGMILGKGCPDPFSRRVIRVSMGHTFRVPIVQSDDLHQMLNELRDEHGFEIAARILDDNAEPLDSASRQDRLALMFGNEGHGLEDEWIEAADRRLTIPMSGGTDSLNVSIAAGIFLHLLHADEVTR